MILVVTSISNYYGGIMERQEQNLKEITRGVFVREEEAEYIYQKLKKWCESIGWRIEHLSRILEKVGINLPIEAHIENLRGAFSLICYKQDAHSNEVYIDMKNGFHEITVWGNNVCREVYHIDRCSLKNYKHPNPRVLMKYRDKHVPAQKPWKYMDFRSLSSYIINNFKMVFDVLEHESGVFTIEIIKNTGLKNKKEIIYALEEKFADFNLEEKDLSKVFMAVLNVVGDIECEYKISIHDKGNETCIYRKIIHEIDEE